MQHFKHLIIHSNLATMVDNGRKFGLIEDAAIAYEDGLITWIGATQSLSAEQLELATVYDAAGQLITPALIDCHTHLIFAGNRAHEFEQRLAGVSYHDIAQRGGGIMHTVKATRNASIEELLTSARERALHLMQQGVLTIEVKSGYGLSFEEEIKLLEIARTLDKKVPAKIVSTFLGAHALPPEYMGKRSEYVDLICKRMIPHIAKNKLADAVDAYCENIGFSRTEVIQIFDAASRWGLPVKLHAEQLSNSHGADLVAEYGGLSADHVEYIDESSIKKMAANDIVATLLPYAFYNLKETHKPPIETFRKHGVNMAVATDCNPGTSPTTNLLQCMHMACTLFGLTTEESWLGVTRNAAQALGLEETIGTLETGKLAHLALWKMHNPSEIIYWQGSNPLERLFY